MSNEIIIESVADFVNALSELGECGKDKSRFFRGHSNKAYVLEPSIYRSDKDTNKKDVIGVEHKITKDVLTECAEYFSPHDTLFDKLVKIQHYDYPTRLLDISYNALVGLYFAISDSKDELKNENDGEVIILDIPNNEIKHHDSDTVAILSALSLRDENFEIKNYKKNLGSLQTLKMLLVSKEIMESKSTLETLSKNENNNKIINDSLEKLGLNLDEFLSLNLNDNLIKITHELFNEQDDIIKLLNDIRKDKSYFLPIINPDDLGKVICVKPKSNNPRITRQQGAFLIFGIDGTKLKMPKVEGQKDWIIHKMTVDASSKKDILEELKSFGISHQTLFPELDKQASHIVKRHKENQK